MSPSIHQRLAYTPHPYCFSQTHLSFRLSHELTTLTNTLDFACKDSSTCPPLVLDGQNIELISIQLNGVELAADAYEYNDQSLVILSPPSSGQLTIITHMSPATNSSLLGLFSSEGDLLTQCEAEGFRRMTYSADRPDVLSVYTVELIANKRDFPILLSNGNLIDSGDLEDGLHFSTWHDPFAKPSYLFALVAGQFSCIEHHIHQKGVDKLLQFYVKPHDVDKVAFAIHSLKSAIDWDYHRFGLALDLERFMVVATSNFNAGAMENKGLNIFNAKYIIADASTTEDDDFASVEAIVGHEYFHNWTGNRVTCQSWFELTLKEGLTVYREQAFSTHQLTQSGTTDLQKACLSAVKRIETVANLRAEQFAEDAGPMAHPVRPDHYEEVSNFYTATIYDKGAEIVRMYELILGQSGFDKGLAHFLNQYDGQAVACENFCHAMAEANQIDLSQFMRWYVQAGTPRLHIRSEYDSDKQTYQLHTRQSNPAVGREKDHIGLIKPPLLIPLVVGLLFEDGNDQTLSQTECAVQSATPQNSEHQPLMLSTVEHTYTWSQVKAKPIPSFNRGFGAPIIVDYDYSDEELLFLIEHDRDLFNRWDAAQRLYKQLVLRQMADPDATLFSLQALKVLQSVLTNTQLTAGYRATLLTFPEYDELAQVIMQTEALDPQALYEALESAQDELADALYQDWLAVYEQLGACEESYDGISAGNRLLKNLCLTHITRYGWLEEHDDATAHAQQQYQQSICMTNRLAAFDLVIEQDDEASQHIIADFHRQFKNEELALDTWFASLAARTGLDHDEMIEEMVKLSHHSDYQNPTPNRVQALIFSFCYANPHHFHQPSGKGYHFLAQQVLELDSKDPQLSASLTQALTHWQKWAEPYRSHAQAALLQIKHAPQHSPALHEVIELVLG